MEFWNSIFYYALTCAIVSYNLVLLGEGGAGLFFLYKYYVSIYIDIGICVNSYLELSAMWSICDVCA